MLRRSSSRMADSDINAANDREGFLVLASLCSPLRRFRKLPLIVTVSWPSLGTQHKWNVKFKSFPFFINVTVIISYNGLTKKLEALLNIIFLLSYKSFLKLAGKEIHS